MIDTSKRNRMRVLGYMWSYDCPCCNWTKHGNKKRKRHIVNKQVRARLKQEMHNIRGEV